MLHYGKNKKRYLCAHSISIILNNSVMLGVPKHFIFNFEEKECRYFSIAQVNYITRSSEEEEEHTDTLGSLVHQLGMVTISLKQHMGPGIGK